MSELRAWHYDGKNAVRRDVMFVAEHDRFWLSDGEWRSGPFSLADLRYHESRDGYPVYRLDADVADGWRLGLREEADPTLAERLPKASNFGGLIDGIGLWPAAFVFAGISAVAMLVVLTAPQWLAPLVPTSVERNLGEAMIGDMGENNCRDPKASAALAKMTAKLDDNPQDLDVMLVNIDMVNAVALPGGKILIFKGLVDEAKSPDEVAGVLAHEIGHVRKRHVMQSLLRQLGMSVVLGGADGNAGTALNTLLATGYSRGAESEADDWSIEHLRTARVDPTDTAEFFRRIGNVADDEDNKKDADNGQAAKAGGADRLLSYISTHPNPADRLQAFRSSRSKSIAYEPIISDAEWKALQAGCSSSKASDDDE